MVKWSSGNRNLRDHAFDQRLIKVCDGGGLLPDEILKVSDQPHLLVSDNAVNFSLLSHFPELENLVRDGIVVVLPVVFLQELLLQFPEVFVDDLWRQGITCLVTVVMLICRAFGNRANSESARPNALR